MTAALPRVLVTRLDSLGDVLLTGPAVRVLARRARVTFLAGPKGEAAARLLPGVDDVLTFACPWIDADAPAVDADSLGELVATVAERHFDAAVILGSSHQSPLPTALALRLAGVPEIAAVSHEYPGSLLDHRLRGDPDVHEVERHLAVVAMLGHEPRPGETLSLAVDRELVPPSAVPGGFVAVHPGASVPARTLAPARWASVVEALTDAGHDVIVTGGPAEVALAHEVAGGHAKVPAGQGSLAELAALLDAASVVVTGNTGPMHVAAAMGTPVVAVFAPTVPAERWRPWGVPSVLLGQLDIACGGCRARVCPLPHQACLDPATPEAVVAAVTHLLSATGAARPPTPRARRARRPALTA